MAYTSINPVAYNNIIRTSEYDVVFDNTTSLHDDVLGVGGVSGNTIGAAAPAPLSHLRFASAESIRRIDVDARDSSFSLLGGSSLTANDTDARIVLYGKNAAGGRSGLFAARSNAADDWEFVEDDNTTRVFGIIASSNELSLGSQIASIRKDSDGSALTLVGGTTSIAGASTSSYVSLGGQGASGGSAVAIVARNGATAADRRIRVQQVAGGTLENLAMFENGNTYFYNPSDNTDYVRVSGESSPNIDFVVNGTQRGSIFATSSFMEVHADGTSQDLRLSAVSDVVIRTSDAVSAYVWQFRENATVVLPDAGTTAPTGLAVGGLFSYDNAGTRELYFYDGTTTHKIV